MNTPVQTELQKGCFTRKLSYFKVCMPFEKKIALTQNPRDPLPSHARRSVLVSACATHLHFPLSTLHAHHSSLLFLRHASALVHSAAHACRIVIGAPTSGRSSSWRVSDDARAWLTDVASDVGDPSTAHSGRRSTRARQASEWRIDDDIYSSQKKKMTTSTSAMVRSWVLWFFFMWCSDKKSSVMIFFPTTYIAYAYLC
jgi:hypothetical protein